MNKLKLFKNNIKKKKGAILADAFIALAVASIMGTAILGYMHLSDKLTDSQLQSIDSYNVATTFLEQLQSSDFSINKDRDGNGVTTTDEKRDNIEELFQRINVDDVDNQNNLVDNASDPNYMFETLYKSNGITYTVSILLEQDTYSEDFHIFTVNVSWQNDNGDKRDIELVGYKVGEL